MRHVVVNHRAFVDEYGYSISTGTHGPASIGERAYWQVCGQRGKSVAKHWKFHPPMDSFFTLHFSEEWLDTDLVIFWPRQDSTQMNMWFSFTTAHQPTTNPAIPGPNSELKKLPPYRPFLNIAEKTTITALKPAIKADILEVMSCNYTDSGTLEEVRIAKISWTPLEAWVLGTARLFQRRMKGFVFKKLCCDRAELWGWGLENETRKLDEGQIAPLKMFDLFKSIAPTKFSCFSKRTLFPDSRPSLLDLCLNPYPCEQVLKQ